MKKKMLLAIVLSVILAIGATVGGIFAYKAIKKNVANKADNDVKYEIMYLEDEYDAGDKLVFRIKAYGAKELTAIKYTIDNGEEIEIACKAGKTPEADKNKGENIVDTKTVVVDLAGLKSDDHLIAFYVYEGNNLISKLGKTRQFKIVG